MQRPDGDARKTGGILYLIRTRSWHPKSVRPDATGGSRAKANGSSSAGQGYLLLEPAGARRERGQPLHFEIDTVPEGLDERRREHRPVDRVLAPVRATAVVVGEAVRPRQLPGAEQLSGLFDHVRIGGKRGDCT